jgi:alanyl-tRNA synthetase
MSLPFTVESLEGLDDSVKSLYVEKDGKYQLAIEGLPDYDAQQTRINQMDSKISELLGEKKKAAEKAREAEEAARKEAEEAARKSNNVEALEKSWAEKLEREKQELIDKYEPDLQLKDQLLQNATVNATATQIISEIGIPGSAKVLMPHIAKRLKMEVRDGKAVTVVTDVDGNPSALTVDDLKKEVSQDEAFKPLIVGTKATGGGANGSEGGSGTPGSGNMGGSKSDRVDAIKSKFPDLE